jgi:nitrite reductase/ring-hydroxylating ferredoxin subunit
MRKVRYAVAQVSDVVPDVGKVVPLGPGGACTLFHHRGKWSAVGSLCPHQNASLDGAPAEGGYVICRRHGYRFDLKSGDCATLGGYGIPVFDVSVDSDTVYVSVWEFD